MVPEVNALERLRANSGRIFRDEDGNEDPFDLLSPLSPSDLAALEQRIPCPLPASMRELLAVTRGWTGGPLESVDFAGLTEFGMEDLFPHAVPIAHDGYGNYWIVDLVSTSTTWGPIFFACHDPPVVVYQADDLDRFVADAFTMMAPPFKGPIDEVHEVHTDRVWRENPGTLPVDAAATSADPDLHAFAESLPPGALVVDLRHPRTGDGLSWGRFGPRTPLFRHGELPLFAYAPVARTRRFWSWLTGR